MGNFKNNGLSWQREPIPVNSYDFRSDADGIAIPYSIYDVRANQGSVFIGVSHDTPAFAVNSLSKWWRYDGQKRYRKRTHMLVLADCGGSNGSRNRAWKFNLQHRLCDPNLVTALLHDSDNPKRISKLRFWGKNAESMESVSYQHSCNNASLRCRLMRLVAASSVRIP